MPTIAKALTCFCLFDLWMNTEVDFSAEFHPFMILAFRTVVCFINFALLLMVLFNTYPIQVGLFDIVAKEARPVLAAHALYVLSTGLLCWSYVDFNGITGRYSLFFFVLFYRLELTLNFLLLNIYIQVIALTLCFFMLFYV